MTNICCSLKHSVLFPRSLPRRLKYENSLDSIYTLHVSVQLCVEALDSLGGKGGAAAAPSVKIPASAPMHVPGSPMSPSILKPVAAIATLVNSRVQRIQQQKERREKRKELMKMAKSAKADSANKGDHLEDSTSRNHDQFDYGSGDSKDDDSDDDAPTSLSWSSSTHATLARDVRLAIERAYASSSYLSTATLHKE